MAGQQPAPDGPGAASTLVPIAGGTGASGTLRKRVLRWIGTNLLLSGLLLTAVTAAVTAAVTTEVGQALNPPGPDQVAEIEGAQAARTMFEAEFEAIVRASGGVRSKLYIVVMQRQAAVDAAFGAGRWEAAQRGYARLAREISSSCEGAHPLMAPVTGVCVRPTQPTQAHPDSGRTEVAGGASHTWSNYESAGGAEGPTLPAGRRVSVACRVVGFTVADGNAWWYRLASKPWDGHYYVSADAFYNDGQAAGSLIGTPLVDPSVPVCSR